MDDHPSRFINMRWQSICFAFASVAASLPPITFVMLSALVCLNQYFHSGIWPQYGHTRPNYIYNSAAMGAILSWLMLATLFFTPLIIAGLTVASVTDRNLIKLKIFLFGAYTTEVLGLYYIFIDPIGFVAWWLD